MFLKRCVVPNVSLKDLFVGATVSVYARQLQITDYADDFTRSKLAAQSQAYALHTHARERETE